MKRFLLILGVLVLAISLFSCSTAPKRKSDKLWIVTDLGRANAGEPNNFDIGQEGGQIDLELAIKYFGGLPGGKEIELEVLPLEDEDLKARISHLKVEIMSGGGPDVFILYSD